MVTVTFLLVVFPSVPLAICVPAVVSAAAAEQLPLQPPTLFVALTLSQVTVMAETGTVEQPDEGDATFTFHVLVLFPPVCVHTTVTELLLGMGLLSGSVAEIEAGLGDTIRPETAVAR